MIHFSREYGVGSFEAQCRIIFETPSLLLHTPSTITVLIILNFPIQLSPEMQCKSTILGI